MSDKRQSEIEWLQSWYQTQCDGVWEHSSIVSIVSIDNPGWWVKVDMKRAPRPDRILSIVGDPPSAKNGNVGGQEWMICQLKGGKFDGAGDPTKLNEIITCFRKEIEDQT